MTTSQELADICGVSLEAWEKAVTMYRGDLIAESKIPYVARNIQAALDRHDAAAPDLLIAAEVALAEYFDKKYPPHLYSGPGRYPGPRDPVTAKAVKIAEQLRAAIARASGRDAAVEDE